MKKRLRTSYYYTIIFLLLFSLSMYAQNKDKEEGYILFPKCENTEGKERRYCNLQELKRFIGAHMEYPKDALDKGYEGKVYVKYILTTNGKIEIPPMRKNQKSSGLEEAAVQVMRELRDSVNSGKIKVIPSKEAGKLVKSYYKFPVQFILPKSDEGTDPESKRKMVIVTYRTSEKTVQFRRDLDGNIYAYNILPEKEELLIKINGNADPLSLSQEEQSYFFLYNLTFLKPEILLTLGKVGDKEYELFINKNAVEEEIPGQKNSDTYINVYYPGNYNNPIEVFRSVDELFSSKYASLLFK